MLKVEGKRNVFFFLLKREKGVLAVIVTWLILPVVICLSQRLSHACVSMNKFLSLIHI